MSNNIFFERGQMADKPNNYLWNGDCLEVMKEIPSKSIDAIICDLPYGTTQCKWDSVIDLKKMWIEYIRIVKDNGVILLFSDEPFTSVLISSNIDNFKQRITWDKKIAGGHLNAKKMLLKRTEDVCLFAYCKNGKYTYNPIMKTKELKNIRDREKENRKPFNGGYVGKHKSTLSKEHNNKESYPDNLVSFSSRTGDCNPIKRLHPTQKPLELLKYLVKTYTNENDWVLDNTCGSNTTGIACYDLNRNYIGIEKDIDIYNVAKKRVEKNILLRANEPKTLFNDRP